MSSASSSVQSAVRSRFGDIAPSNALDLPSDALIGFPVWKLAHPSIVWTDGSRDPLEFTFAAPLTGEPPDAYLADGKIALAERYGGAGVGKNGGGARCGLLNGQQIKGIGRNPLASDSAPYWHSYGGATLAEGVKELLFSRLLSKALPFGTTIVRALLTTGTKVAMRYPRPGGAQDTPRCLIVRDSAIRLGHFMPAAHFDAGRGSAEESDRMRAMAEQFPLFLSQAWGKSMLGHATFESCFDLLIRALADQLAASMAKRVVHGGLSLSNLAIDGRWIDFGMSTAVGDYGPLITSGRKPSFDSQPRLLAMRLGSLAAYVAGCAAPAVLDLPSRREVQDRFLAAFDASYGARLLDLTGLPWAPGQDSDRLASCMKWLIAQSSGEPVKLLSVCPRYVSRTPEHMGEYRLGSLLTLASLGRTADERDRLAKPAIKDDRARETFIAAYTAVAASGNADAQAGYIAVNAIRLNTPLRRLYRENLNAEIDEVIERGASVGSLVDSITSELEPLLGHAPFGEPISMRLEGLTIRATPAHDPLFGGRPMTLENIRNWATSATGNRVLALDVPRDQLYSNWNVDGKSKYSDADDVDRVAAIRALLSSLGTYRLDLSVLTRDVLEPCISRGSLREFYSEDKDLVGYVAWAPLEHREIGDPAEVRVLHVAFLKGRLRYALRRMLQERFLGAAVVVFQNRLGFVRRWKIEPRASRYPLTRCKCGSVLAECAMLEAS